MYCSKSIRAELSVVEKAATRDHYKTESRKVTEDFLVRDLIVTVLSDLSEETDNLVWVGLIWHNEHARDYHGIFEVGRGIDTLFSVDDIRISHPYKAHMCKGSDAGQEKLLDYLVENNNGELMFDVANQAICSAAWGNCEVRSSAKKHFYRKIPNDTLAIETGVRGASITGWLFVGTRDSTVCENLEALNNRINELIALGQRRCALGEVDLRRILANITISHNLNAANFHQPEEEPRTEKISVQNKVTKVSDEFINNVKDEFINDVKKSRGRVLNTVMGSAYAWMDDSKEKIDKRVKGSSVPSEVISLLVFFDDSRRLELCVTHFCDLAAFKTLLNCISVDESANVIVWKDATIVVCVSLSDLSLFKEEVLSLPSRITNRVVLRLQC